MTSLLGQALSSFMPSQANINTPASVDDLLNIAVHAEGIDGVTKQLVPVLKQLAQGTNAQHFFTQLTSENKDPLEVLNPERHSITYAYFLDARCRVEKPDAQSLLSHVLEFFEVFDRQQLQLVPEKLYHVGQGLARLAGLYGNNIIPIKPLANAIRRFAPSPNHLTNLHQLFVKECILSKCYKQALSVLDNDITEIDLQTTGITYIDHLLYHYYGGMVYIGLKNYERAMYFLRLAISAPSAAPSAIQIESFKKYILVSLLLYGKVVSLPKYTANVVVRSVKNHCQAYQDYATAFESLNVKRVRNELQKCSDVFKKDKNLGLAKQTLEAIYRLKIQQLTQTYLTLSITDIADAVGLEGPNASKVAEDYILHMIESREIFATISHSHQGGMVSFHDNPDRYNSSLTVTKLEEQIAKAAVVNQRVMKTDQLIGCSKEYLSKQHLGLSGGIPGGLGPADEADFLGSGTYEPFLDEGRYFV